MKLKQILFLCLSFVIFANCNSRIQAQNNPFKIIASQDADSLNTFPIDQSFIAFNSTREKFGLQKIDNSWRVIKVAAISSHSAPTFILIDGKGEKRKSVAAGGIHPKMFFIESELKKGKLNGKTLSISSGKAYLVKTYKENVPNGLTQYFDDNEKVIFQIEYKNGVPWNGQEVNYSSRENKHFRMDSYQEGIKHGKCGVYNNGIPEEEKFYEKGILTKELRYYINEFAGVLSSEEIYDNRKGKSYKSWHENKTLAYAKAFTLNSKRHGIFQTWDTTGILTDEVEFINGKQHGKQYVNSYGTAHEIWYWNGKKLEDQDEFNSLALKYPKPEISSEDDLIKAEKKEERRIRWSTNLRNNKNLVLTLEESLFSKDDDLRVYRSALTQIEKSKDITLIPSLMNFYSKLKTQMSYEYDPEIHPVENEKVNQFLLSFRRTLLVLEMEKNGVKTEKEEIKYLLGEIKTKLTKEVDYIDAEYYLLKKYAQKLEAQSLKLIDKENHHYLKLVGLLLLKEAKNENLEKIILERIEKYRNNSPVFGWMAQILATDGSEQGLEYFFNQLDETDKDTRREIIFSMKKLSKGDQAFLEQKKIDYPLLGNAMKERLSMTPSDVRKKFSASNFNYAVTFRKGGMTRRFWLGEYLGDRSTEELITILESVNEDLDNFDERANEVKAAYLLGDRQLAGELELNKNQEERIEKIVLRYLELEQSKKNSGGWWSPSLQMERLWLVAEPTLLKNIENPDQKIVGLVFTSLRKMKSEQLVKNIITIANDCKDRETCNHYISLLKNMNFPTGSSVSRRKTMDDDAFQKIYDELIIAFL